MESFGRCCQICSELEDTEALHEARVQYGIAKGHQMMGSFSSRIIDCSSHGLQSLVGWKDARIVPVDTHDAPVTVEEQETIKDPEIVNVEEDTGHGELTNRQESRKNSEDINDSTQVT